MSFILTYRVLNIELLHIKKHYFIHLFTCFYNREKSSVYPLKVSIICKMMDNAMFYCIMKTIFVDRKYKRSYNGTLWYTSTNKIKNRWVIINTHKLKFIFKIWRKPVISCASYNIVIQFLNRDTMITTSHINDFGVLEIHTGDYT